VQQRVGPRVVTGIAVAGAGLIAVAPITAPLADVHVPAVQLTTTESMLADAGPSALVSDVLDPYVNVFTTAFSDLHTIIADRLADPTPILSAALSLAPAELAFYLLQAIDDPATIVDIPGEMARQSEDVVAVLTSFFTANTDITTSPPTLDVMLGGVTALLLSGMEVVFGAWEGGQEIMAELTSGNPVTALTGLVDAPATLANSLLPALLQPPFDLLNDIPITFTADQVDQWNPLLAEMGQPTLAVTTYDATISGFGAGLVELLVNYVPQQIAAALTAPPDIVAGPLEIISGVLSGHLSTGDLPAALAADVSAQLPALLADPLSLLAF
jgi:hypothetical protein